MLRLDELGPLEERGGARLPHELVRRAPRDIEERAPVGARGHEFEPCAKRPGERAEGQPRDRASRDATRPRGGFCLLRPPLERGRDGPRRESSDALYEFSSSCGARGGQFAPSVPRRNQRFAPQGADEPLARALEPSVRHRRRLHARRVDGGVFCEVAPDVERRRQVPPERAQRAPAGGALGGGGVRRTGAPPMERAVRRVGDDRAQEPPRRPGLGLERLALFHSRRPLAERHHERPSVPPPRGSRRHLAAAPPDRRGGGPPVERGGKISSREARRDARDDPPRALSLCRHRAPPREGMPREALGAACGEPDGLVSARRLDSLRARRLLFSAPPRLNRR